MQSVGIYEAKSRFSALIELVEQGEEVRITRHGKEVVRMLPVRRRPVITDEQIARELGQSPRTVEMHRARLLRKLGVRSTTQLLAHLA